MEKIFTMPANLNVDHSSWQFLARLQNNIIESPCDTVILDFTNCNFSHAAYTAFIGGLSAICMAFRKKLIYRCRENSNLLKYFQRSGLYSYITDSTPKLVSDNAIRFIKVDLDDSFIIDYIIKILDLAPIQLTDNSYGVLFQNIYEIFNNSIDHSRAQHGVFACGHWMPQKRELVFSVYDTGIGIPALIQQRINPSISSKDAIIWALKKGNSTKQLVKGTPRGLGLSNLFDLIKLNDGALNIFTHDAYFCYKTGKTSCYNIDVPIIGTMINFSIKADPDHIYTVK